MTPAKAEWPACRQASRQTDDESAPRQTDRPACRNVERPIRLSCSHSVWQANSQTKTSRETYSKETDRKTEAHTQRLTGRQQECREQIVLQSFNLAGKMAYSRETIDIERQK